MIFTHVLCLVLGALIAFAVLGSALETVVLPQEGFPRLAQFVFALVYRLVVHRRNNRLARSLRRLYAPVALVSLPLVWMIFMMAAFTCIYWGTHDLSWSRAFETSVSSITTLGFSEPNGPGRICGANLPWRDHRVNRVPVEPAHREVRDPLSARNCGVAYANLYIFPVGSEQAAAGRRRRGQLA